jgi:hypothetical protein
VAQHSKQTPVGFWLSSVNVDVYEEFMEWVTFGKTRCIAILLEQKHSLTKTHNQQPKSSNIPRNPLTGIAHKQANKGPETTCCNKQ